MTIWYALTLFVVGASFWGVFVLGRRVEARSRERAVQRRQRQHDAWARAQEAGRQGLPLKVKP